VTFIARGYPEQARGLGLGQPTGLVLRRRKCGERAARDIGRRAKASGQIVRDRQGNVHDPRLHGPSPKRKQSFIIKDVIMGDRDFDGYRMLFRLRGAGPLG
jgi:hypothetical protein